MRRTPTADDDAKPKEDDDAETKTRMPARRQTQSSWTASASALGAYSESAEEQGVNTTATTARHHLVYSTRAKHVQGQLTSSCEKRHRDQKQPTQETEKQKEAQSQRRETKKTKKKEEEIAKQTVVKTRHRKAAAAAGKPQPLVPPKLTKYIPRDTGEQESDAAFLDIMDFGENEAPKGTDPVSAGAAPAEQYTSVASSSARSGVPTEELAIRARAIAQRRAIEEYDQKARLQKTPSPRAPAAKKAAPKPETEWVPGHTKVAEPALPPRARGAPAPKSGLAQKVIQMGIKLDKLNKRK
ncbi:unnamed protein product [Symbiodinium sp. CCMP2456]|nr:unnamed protein product [Symbiodinium sp. CCMP2456]